jgi:hypothetical protein
MEVMEVMEVMEGIQTDPREVQEGPAHPDKRATNLGV